MLQHQTNPRTMQFHPSAASAPFVPEKPSNPYPSTSSSEPTAGTSALAYGRTYQPPYLGSSAYPFELHPGSLNLGSFYHSSRSSVSSSDSHLFSPKQAVGAPQYSPCTPPYPSIVQPIASNPMQSFERSHYATEDVKPKIKREGSAEPLHRHPVTTQPIAPMPPGFVSSLASYLADMVVYLWYSPPGHKRAPAFPKPTTLFAGFCQDVLTTTQVSQSVVVLALLFIWKLQSKHAIEPLQGSEFRLTITALMLANKIIDDHTYTNKTWSEVSGLPVQALNEGEMEFLQGLDFSLHVSHTTFAAWMGMLQRPPHVRTMRSSSMRKKLKLDSSFVTAPSAPASPTLPADANLGLGLNFDSISSIGPAVLPGSSSLAAESIAIPAYSSPAIPTASSFASHAGQTGSKKRKLSTSSADQPRPSTSSGTAGYHCNSLPLPSSTMMLPVSSASSGFTNTYTPISASSGAIDYGFLPNQSGQADDSTQTEFSTLMAKQTPPDLRASRDYPIELAYYALAAGQQRGGYLAYQPAAVPAPSWYLQPQQAARSYAPLPKHAQSGQFGQSRQSGQTTRAAHSVSPSQALSAPGGAKPAFAPAPALYPSITGPVGQQMSYTSYSAASSPVQAIAAAAHSYPYPSSLPSHSPRHAYKHPQQPHQQAMMAVPGLQPVQLQSISQASAAASQARQPMPSHGQAFTNGYYSSFSNSGLPGVVQWTTQTSRVSGVFQPYPQPAPPAQWHF